MELREKIARVISGGSLWDGDMDKADAILSLPEIAEALALIPQIDEIYDDMIKRKGNA